MSSGHIGQMSDAEVVRLIRRELARFPVDANEAIVSCSHGVVHLNGRVRPIRGQEDIFSEELTKIYRVLRQRPFVRDVILEWSIPDGYTRFGATSKTRSK